MIHQQVIDEYSRDNPVDNKGLLSHRTSTLDYRETVEILASLYIQYCFSHRLVVAPTGSKLQAVGTAIIKAICYDIHIEYPMPAKYFAENYSSVEIRKIHQIDFLNFKECLRTVDVEFGLNGTW